MHVRLAILPSTPLDVHVRTTCHDPGTHSMMVTDHPASRLHRVVMFDVKRADDRVYNVQRLGTLLQGMARLARWLLLSEYEERLRISTRDGLRGHRAVRVSYTAGIH